MKRIILLFIVFINTSDISLHAVMSTHIFPQKNLRQFIIHFAQDPRHEKEHKEWNQALYVLKDRLNHTLKNEVFFTRIDHDFGHCTLSIPDGIPEKLFIKELQRNLDDLGLSMHIDKDSAVMLASSAQTGLEGVALTLFELEALKRVQRGAGTKKDTLALAPLEKKTKISTLQEQLFWHHRIPSVGLRLEKPFYPPPYPYLPHFFSLWQLAPKKGKGIRLALIDTGLAAVEFKNMQSYKKNIDLTLAHTMLNENLNIVSNNGLDPVEQLVSLVYPSLKPQEFNEIEVTYEIIEWIYDYLHNKSTQKIIEYLKKHGKETLFVQGALSPEGKKVIEAITTGPYGILPRQGDAPLQLAFMEKPFMGKFIQELLPIVPISSQFMTYIAGHGSHTYGLAAGIFQGTGFVPEDDKGVCGIAPEADAFMIKAFKDDGTSNKSTLIAGLKKAILYNADVVSLSLKIADNLNVTASLSKLLKRMIDLVPYVVAASGNGGDPKLRNYAGTVEAYPARFESVAFDVGSFGYESFHCLLNDFSQFEKEIGPKFVAPGFNILSSGLVPGQTEDSMYLFMDGTSMATPIMAGFVVLMLAEFQGDFTRDELLNVCYTATFRMHNDADWTNKVLLGALDMRTVLFVLHVLREARKQKTLKNISFTKLLAATYELIFAPVRAYGILLGKADFTGNFMDYFTKAYAQRHVFFNNYTQPATVQDALNSVVHNLLAAQSEEYAHTSALDQKVIKRITTLFKAKKDPDIYAHFAPQVQERIKITEKKEDYWQQRARGIRQQFIDHTYSKKKEH